MKKLNFVSIVLCSSFFLLPFVYANAQTGVDVNVNCAQQHAISPNIYGKNGGSSDGPNNPDSEAHWQLLQEAGLHFIRGGGGNNSTKYNWQKHLSSHPDWYNNVYSHNWG